MSISPIETSFFQHYSEAINHPLIFLQRLPMRQRKDKGQTLCLSLNAAIANIVCCNSQMAIRDLEALKPRLQMTADPFLMSRMHLIKHTALFQTSSDISALENELALAVKYQGLSGSSALESEVMLHKFHANINNWEITQSEDILQRAMTAAIESGQQELILDVYLAYVQLYLNKNLVEQANREVLLLQEMIHPEETPLKFVHLCNFRGIIAHMTKSGDLAAKSYRTGAELADQHGYNYQLVQLWMNLGICMGSQGDFNGSIAMYDKCLQLLSRNEGAASILEHKLVSNKARALSMSNRIPEAVDLMSSALEEAQNVGWVREANIIKVNLADSLIEIERFEGVLEMISSAIAYFEENKLWDLAQSAHLCKARYYESKQDYQPAFESMEELFQVSRKLFQENFASQNRRYRQRIEELRVEYFKLKNNCSSLGSVSAKNSGINLIGDHHLIKTAISNAIQAAKYPYVNVHIYGESGTGKEIIARLLHESAPDSKTMVAVNASAISPNLIESELFGHVKGAFTGAISDHKGKFMLADEGTLFLDEISDMPLDCQAKLLRAIEHQSIVPVGSDREHKVRCRIVSASNRRLTDLVKANSFRLDLYHRLNKVEIYLPPLRERKSDLPTLTEHFVKRFAREFGHGVPTLSESFLNRLQQHSFPGNVRELMNIIERIFILSPKQHWDAEQLDGLIDETPHRELEADDIIQSLQQKERQLITETLQKVNWKQKEAAKLLNMTESTLSRHIKKLEISKY